MVNPEVYKPRTLFVQCPNPDCAVWHKIVDNLGLIHEVQGRRGRRRELLPQSSSTRVRKGEALVASIAQVAASSP